MAPVSFDDIDQANSRIAELEEQLLKAKSNTKTIQLKVSEKGCVQINGIRKFPFTFYQDEIKTIIGMSNEIIEFIDQNQNRLSKKS
jgi:hypothetical protein